MLTTITLADISKETAETVEWLKSLRIKIDDTRIPETLKYAQLFAEEFEIRKTSIAEYTDVEKSGSAIDEACTLNLIRTSFFNTKSATVKDKIRASILGTFSSLDETSDTNKPRNYMYELEMAAYFIACGYDVTDELNDVNYVNNNFKINVQCKRPLSKDTVVKNFNKALTQLITKNRITTISNSFGFVAISLEKIYELDKGIYLVNNKEELQADMDLKRDEITNILVDSWNGTVKEYNEKGKTLRLVGNIYYYKRPVIYLDRTRFTFFRRFLYSVPDFPPNAPQNVIMNFINSKDK